MTKSKDIKKAKEEGSFRERQDHKDEPRLKCPFPGCGRTFWHEDGKPNACNYHRQLISDFVHIMNHLKTPSQIAQQQDKKLVVPQPGNILGKLKL